MRVLAAIFLALLATTSVAAETFIPARIVDLQNRSEMKADTLGRALGAGSAAITQDRYLRIVFETTDRRITARTFAMGGGSIWALNHPEAFLVGSEVSIAIDKRGRLLVNVQNKELKFTIERMEIIEL